MNTYPSTKSPAPSHAAKPRPSPGIPASPSQSPLEIALAADAAPELLAALKAVMERCEVFENVPSDAGRIIESARAAIAKAEGRA